MNLCTLVHWLWEAEATSHKVVKNHQLKSYKCLNLYWNDGAPFLQRLLPQRLFHGSKHQNLYCPGEQWSKLCFYWVPIWCQNIRDDQYVTNISPVEWALFHLSVASWHQFCMYDFVTDIVCEDECVTKHKQNTLQIWYVQVEEKDVLLHITCHPSH